jgi:hypothetical protein
MVTYIHIGMPKTGTTFLQKALFQKSKDLARKGVVYPNPLAGLGRGGRATAHHFLAHALSGRRRRYTPLAEFSTLPDHVEALKAEIAQGGGTGLLSSEDFASLKLEGIAELRRHFPTDTRILVYLRRQDAWIDSLFGQFLKVGRDTTIDRLIHTERWRLDYAAFLQPWADNFGAENIVVRVYEKLQGIDLWRDLFAALGRPDLGAEAPEFESANDSLSVELTMFLKALNIYGEQPELRRIFEGLSGHFPNRPGLKYLSAAQAQDLLAKHEASNRKVAQTYLKRPALFTDLAPLDTAERPELTTTQVIQIFGGVTIRLMERIRKLEARKGLGQPEAKDPETRAEAKPASVGGAARRLLTMFDRR